MPLKRGGRRPGAGRKPHAPDDKARKYVETMTAVGINEDEIARVLDVAPKTLRKHYRLELDTAAIKANAAVGQTWFNMATGGGRWQDANPAAMIWWTKIRMGAKEPKPAVQDVNMRVGVYDMSKLSDDELQRIAAAESILEGVAITAGGGESGDSEA